MGIFDEEEEEEEVEKKGWKQYLKWEFVIITIAIIYMMIFKGRTGVKSVDNAMFNASVVILAVAFFSLTNVAYKQASPKFVTASGHTTIEPNAIRTVGNFTLVRGGGVHAGGIHWAGRADTTCVPTSSVTKVGKDLVSTCRTWECDMEELPDEVQREVIQRNYPRPLRIGYADEEQYLNMVSDVAGRSPSSVKAIAETGLNKSSVAQLVQHMRELQRTNSFQQTLMRREGESMEDYIARISRITTRAKGTKFERFLKTAIGIKEE